MAFTSGVGHFLLFEQREGKQGSPVYVQGRGVQHHPLHFVHINHVVVGGVKVAGVGSGNPRRVAAGAGVVNLALQHFGHGAVADLHTLADFAVAVDTGAEAHVHVVALVADVEGFLGEVVAEVNRAGVHLGAYLGAGAVEEAGVGEEDPALGGAKGVGQLQGHAQFFVHYADEDAAPD